MRKKVFAIILTLCMVLTMMPAVAWAKSGNVEIWYDYGIEDGETLSRRFSLAQMARTNTDGGMEESKA